MQADNIREKRSTAPAPKRESSWFDLTLSLVDDIDPRTAEDLPDYVPPKLQVRVLSELSESADLQQLCAAKEVDFSLMTKLWKAVIAAMPKTQLDAFLYTCVVLHRLGYGYSMIADNTGQPKSLVVATLRNLHLDLGAHHGHSFDVTVLLVRKEVMTSTRIAELCGVPKEIGRLIIKRCGQREELLKGLSAVLERGDAVHRVVWLFERGLSLQAICTVLRLEERTIAPAFIDENGS